MSQNQQTTNKIRQAASAVRCQIMRILLFACILMYHEAEGVTFINGMYYDLNSSNKTASLASATGQYGTFGGYAGDVVIPSSVVYQNVTYTVTTIQEGCFYDCKDMTSLTIPASVTKIAGTHVFYGCTGIKSVTLEDGDNPITIPGCIYSTQLGNTKATFHFSKLDSIYVGRSITPDSSGSPFYGQSSLTKAVIGPNVSELPSGFIYGSAVSNLTLPEGIKKIGGDALASMPNLKEIIFPNSLETIGWGCCSGSAIESAYIGDNVKILEGTFHSCSNLKSVYLGSGITTIGTNTFAWSNNLSKIFIFSDNLTTLDSPGFPDGLGQILVNNPDRYKNLFSDKYLDKLIVFNNSVNVYSGTVPKLNYQNFVDNTSVSYSVPDNYINVGSYNITIPVTFQYKNWSSQTSASVSYSVEPAQLTVIAQNTSRKYGNPNPDFTCSYFGFKNNETVDVLTKLPEIATTATSSSNVGTYPIIPSGAEAQNYTFNYERGALTITKADQIIEWEQKLGTVNAGDVIELTATSTAGLPIKYTSTDETIAEIFTQGGKKFVEFLKPGFVSLRATQEGNENYNEADRVSKPIKVNMPVSSIVLSHNAATIAEGNSLQLTATISPNNATNSGLTWESADTAIATVDANGKVTALKQGSTVITAKSTDGSGISASCSITVVKLVTAIFVSSTKVDMKIGEQYTLTAYATPSDATNTHLRWSSEDKNVATVEDGVVTAIGPGATFINVESTDGSNIIERCEIEVRQPSAINPISSDNISVYVTNNTIKIVNIPANNVVQIFNIAGSLIMSEVSTGDIISFQPTACGIYLVVVDDCTYKVIVR